LKLIKLLTKVEVNSLVETLFRLGVSVHWAKEMQTVYTISAFKLNKNVLTGCNSSNNSYFSILPISWTPFQSSQSDSGVLIEVMEEGQTGLTRREYE